MPCDWSAGVIRYNCALPFEPPSPPAVSSNGAQVFTLNAALTRWAHELTTGILPVDAELQVALAGYADAPTARRAPFIRIGDTLMPLR